MDFCPHCFYPHCCHRALPLASLLLPSLRHPPWQVVSRLTTMLPPPQASTTAGAAATGAAGNGTPSALSDAPTVTQVPLLPTPSPVTLVKPPSTRPSPLDNAGALTRGSSGGGGCSGAGDGDRGAGGGDGIGGTMAGTTGGGDGGCGGAGGGGSTPPGGMYPLA